MIYICPGRPGLFYVAWLKILWQFLSEISQGITYHIAKIKSLKSNVRASMFCHFFWISSMYPAVMIPAGRATIAMPINAETMVMNRPVSDVAKMSP